MGWSDFFLFLCNLYKTGVFVSICGLDCAKRESYTIQNTVIMYKTLLLATALLVPAFAQDEAKPAEGAPTPDAPQAQRGQRGQRGGAPGGFRMMAGPGMALLIEEVVMDKYDADKDGKLDDTEKASLKEAADKAREAQRKAREERAAQRGQGGEGRPEGAEGPRRPRGEGGEGRPEGRGPRGQRGQGGEGRPEGAPPRPEGAPQRPAIDPEMMIVGMSMLVEQYDTDKDGRINPEEAKPMLEAAKKLADEKAPKKDEAKEEAKSEE